VTTLLTGYLATWVAFCLLAAGIAITSVRVSVPDAAAFLRVPWKLVLFVPAVVFVTFAGAFTDDETWDVVSGGGMALLTFLTSWWSVGVAVRALRGLVPLRYAVVALAVTLFSSSWFYDGYLLLRDGSYTSRWLGNLLLSPTIYLCAGLVMNLELCEGDCRVDGAVARAADAPYHAGRRGVTNAIGSAVGAGSSQGGPRVPGIPFVPPDPNRTRGQLRHVRRIG
jgi:hypothetical protein